MWFLDLLTQSTIAHAILLYAFVIAFGVILGKVKIFGVSLGVTFVLFVGIIVGQLYYSFQPDAPAIDPGVLHFIKELSSLSVFRWVPVSSHHSRKVASCSMVLPCLSWVSTWW